MRVLIAEDDVGLGRAIRRGLEEAAYTVDVVTSGEDAAAAAASTPFDLIVLDIMLPGSDGLSVCRDLRQQRVETPILILTARDAVPDRVRGLEAGADDYLVKPFSFAELLARLRALSRRHLAGRSSILELGDLRLDTAARTLTVRGRLVPLRTKELAVLEYFMHHPGQLLTKTQLEEHAWNYDFTAESNLVKSYISRIRRKLIAAGAEDPLITVRGAGYRFEVRACAASSAEPASA